MKHSIHRTTHAGAALLAALLALDGAVARAQTFRPEVVGTGFPNAMNSHGQVVGWRSEGGAVRAWVSTLGVQILLPIPPGMGSSRAYDVNDDGVIAGMVAQGGLASNGFPAIWRPAGAGYEIELLTPLTTYTYGTALVINNLGDVAGDSILSGWMSGPATLYVDSTAPGAPPVSLSALGFAALPRGINDQRQVVGGSLRLDLDTLLVENLGLPPSPPNYITTTGYAVNEAGQVAGVARLATSGNDPLVAARYTDGVGWEVLSGPGALNNATGIGEDGTVSLEYGAGAAMIPALYVDGAGLLPLEDVLAPGFEGWSFTNTFDSDVNSVGQVVAVGGDATQGGVTILTPVAGVSSILGCGTNPAGSFAVQGAPSIASAVQLAVHNPLGTQAPGSLSLVGFSLGADAGFPCGLLVPGWGMAGGPGELLLGAAAPGFSVLGPLWTGAPVQVPLFLPNDATLVGAKLFAQGVLFDPTPGAAVAIGLTEGAFLRLGS